MSSRQRGLWRGSEARAGLLSALCGKHAKATASLAALAAVHGNAAQNLQPPPVLVAGAGSQCQKTSPSSTCPAGGVLSVAPATKQVFGSSRGRRCWKRVPTRLWPSEQCNSSGMGIGFRAGYQRGDWRCCDDAGQRGSGRLRFRAGNSSQKPPQAASFAVLPSPVAHNSNWQVARQQTQRMGRAVAAFTATALPSAANSQYRSASVSSLPSETSSVNTGGVGLPRKDLNLTPQHNVNGSAFALTFDDGSLGLSLVPTTYGYAMISEPAEVGSQAGKYDLLPGDYVIAVGKFPLAKPGYMGVDGIVAALGQLAPTPHCIFQV